MKITIGRFLMTDTVEQIAVKLARRPANYILYQTTIAGGGGYEGCIGRKAYTCREQLGVVCLSIFQ